MMWIPLRSMKMKRFIFGFHRRAWCPKWTPDLKSCFIVTTATAFSLDASASRPRRALAGRRRDLVKRAKYRARLTRSAINCNKNGQRAPAGARGRKKPGRRCPGSFRTPKALGEVVADVAEDVLELTTEEDHGDDDGNGDNSNDESVLNQALAFVVAEECEHFAPPFIPGSAERRLPPRRSLGTAKRSTSPPVGPLRVPR